MWIGLCKMELFRFSLRNLIRQLLIFWGLDLMVVCRAGKRADQARLFVL